MPRMTLAKNKALADMNFPPVPAVVPAFFILPAV